MRGFTLVEILVASLIMGIIMAALFMSLSVGQRSWFTGDTAVELRDQTVKAIMTMNKELSQTAASGTHEINLATGASANRVTFYLPYDNNHDGSVVDANGSIEWTGAIIYSLNGANQIIRSVQATNSVSVLGNDITALQFTRTADKIIQIDVTAQKTPQAGQKIRDQEQTIIKMRN